MLIAIDIGGTKTEIALGNRKGEIAKRKIISTNAEFNPFCSSLFAAIKNLSKGRRIKGIGVAAPGPLDPIKGIIFSSPNLKWSNICLKEILEKEFAVPTIIENDANLAGLGEKTLGAGKKSKSLFYLTLSTGIGGAFILNKKIYQGATFDAGEIGHNIILPNGPKCNCGRSGCLEALSSGTAIARKAREKISKNSRSLILKLAGNKKELITAQTVVKAVSQGDELAQQIWNEACYFLGIGIANMISLLNPEMVIIGGGVSKAGSVLFKPLRKIVKELSWERAIKSCQIVKAKLKNPGIVGALVCAPKRGKNA